MKNLTILTICIFLFACKKEKSTEYSFKSCNLTSSNLEVLTKQDGTLIYTNKLGSIQLANYSFFIIISGALPLQICNMPSSIRLRQDEVQKVSFSGKMIVLPSTTDALSTTLELSALNIH